MADTQTLFLRPPVWALLLAVVVGGGFYLGGKQIEAQDRTPTIISVSGVGKVSAPPDIAELTFGVQTGRKTTAKDAMAMLKTNMDAALAAVKAAGIADKDITTEQFSLNPSYDWTDGQQILRGFEASESLRVKVRNLDKVSDVLGAATGAGANQAGSVSFIIDDPESVRSQAREKAVSQAKAKAEKLAADLGLRLGRIKGFSEGGGVVPPIAYDRSYSMKALDSAVPQAVPMPAGEQDVTVDVTLTYELK